MALAHAGLVRQGPLRSVHAWRPAVTTFAEVAVDAPAGHGRTFTYSIPPSLNVKAGQPVTVPFGPRQLQGLVFSLGPVPQFPDTRDVLSVPGGGPTLSQVQLALARWISGYYLCSLFEAAAPMLPPGGRLRLKAYLTPAPNVDGPVRVGLSPEQTRVLQYVGTERRVAEERVLEAMGPRARTAIGRLVESGYLVRTMARSGAAVSPKYLQYARLAPATFRLPIGELSALSRRAPRQAALVERLKEVESGITLTEARKEYGHGAVRAMLAKGWIVKEAVPVSRDPLAGRHFPPAPPVTLTALQRKAAAAVREALDKPSASHRRLLVQGVTGSGKTEIYLHAVRRCLQIGKRAIVMVPEIALTEQTIERFATRFPGEVAVLHSRLSPGERFDQWWKIRRGEYAVVVGSRSAVFAPQPDLGLIVIDEEHEWTYKQHDASPRYHARDVARRLAELSGAVLVLGSATPDLGSYHSTQTGRSHVLSLPKRVTPDRRPLGPPTGAGLAAAEVVDMRSELRAGNREMFSRALHRAMGECLGSGSQALLFLNRRGTSSFMQCRSCGFGLRCRRCDVGMTYHRQANRLLCHYCGDKRIPPPKCPRCHALRMSYYGLGTQAVVDEVRARFPEANVLRWDRDAARRPDEYRGLLERFRSGEAQVLVGTQMIAKGLHFPSVTLVGVVMADVGLYVPDFRAGERAFQLLCQVAGRAGRGPREGRVIFQTYQPENYAIRAAAAQDYSRFYREEMAHRREQGNPPFSRLIRLLYNHANRARCEAEALRLAGLLRQEAESSGHSEIEVLGPTPGHPSRLRGRYRWQLILRGAEPRSLLDKVPVPQSWAVDVDPVGTA